MLTLPTKIEYDFKQEKLERIRFEQLRLIAQSAAKANGGSWIDIDYDKATEIRREKEDDRKAEDIIADVAKRAGLEIIQDECV